MVGSSPPSSPPPPPPTAPPPRPPHPPHTAPAQHTPPERSRLPHSDATSPPSHTQPTTRADGSIDITGKFHDTLKASYNGTDVVGDLTMNGVAYHFTAPAVPAPAGMYTAELNGVRASWVVRPDGTATGVQNNGNDSDTANL